MGYLAPAASPPDPGAAASQLRVGQLAPDTPAVDILVSSQFGPDRFLVAGVAYGKVMPSHTLPASPAPPGPWRIDVRPAGFSESAAPLLSTVLLAQPGASYTVVAAGPTAALKLISVTDEVPVADAGTAWVRVFNASKLDPIAVHAPWTPGSGTSVPSGEFGPYQAVPGGSLAGTVSGTGVPPTELTGTVTAGCSYTAVVEQGSGALGTTVFEDACGTAEAVAGSAGGRWSWSWPATGLVVGATLLAAALALGALRRRRRRGPPTAQHR